MSKHPSIIDTEVTPELLFGLQSFLAFIDDGTNTEAIFGIAAVLAKHEVTIASMTYLKSHPEIVQLFEEQYIAPTPNLETLIKLPEDSLGFAYVSHMQAANLSPEFFPKVEIQDDVSYLTLRMRQTHDIWHTVTGFGTDSVGEIQLLAFQLAQNRSPFAVMLIAAITLNMIKMNNDLNPLVNVIQHGYNLGYQAKPFLAQKWEEAWEKPLSNWRAELNISLGESNRA
jgi:ubiquinone biosynthesis protein COQ4